MKRNAKRQRTETKYDGKRIVAPGNSNGDAPVEAVLRVAAQTAVLMPKLGQGKSGG